MSLELELPELVVERNSEGLLLQPSEERAGHYVGVVMHAACILLPVATLSLAFSTADLARTGAATAIGGVACWPATWCRGHPGCVGGMRSPSMRSPICRDGCCCSSVAAACCCSCCCWLLGQHVRSPQHPITHTNWADTRGTMEKNTHTNFGRRSGQHLVSSTVRTRFGGERLVFWTCIRAFTLI